MNWEEENLWPDTLSESLLSRFVWVVIQIHYDTFNASVNEKLVCVNAGFIVRSSGLFELRSVTSRLNIDG